MRSRNSGSFRPLLRRVPTRTPRLVDCYASYFGALTCVAWSPDGRFILVSGNCQTFTSTYKLLETGGQDDLLTIFSPWEQRVVARCQGHSSFVSAVAFDDLRCDGRTYRFGSVGEDNKLILVCVGFHPSDRDNRSCTIQWDFSSGALHRPKFQVTRVHPAGWVHHFSGRSAGDTSPASLLDNFFIVQTRPFSPLSPLRLGWCFRS